MVLLTSAGAARGLCCIGDCTAREAKLAHKHSPQLPSAHLRACVLPMQGLAQQGALRDMERAQVLANPALPDDILREAVPGNIRRAGRCTYGLELPWGSLM